MIDVPEIDLTDPAVLLDLPAAYAPARRSPRWYACWRQASARSGP
ncbi:hypothetical protein ACFQYP_23040 [Nonomuraea antimicrobica]